MSQTTVLSPPISVTRKDAESHKKFVDQRHRDRDHKTETWTGRLIMRSPPQLDAVQPTASMISRRCIKITGTTIRPVRRIAETPRHHDGIPTIPCPKVLAAVFLLRIGPSEGQRIRHQPISSDLIHQTHRMPQLVILRPYLAS